MKNTIRYFTIILLLMSVLSLSCERLKKKMEIRERRIQYLKSTIDSARNNRIQSIDTTNNKVKQ
ncbi:MAG: hypothetical protein EBU66_08155 [Bacteroidetes bacterium]|nr:hypothetical protein [bacterium]NBP64619.1 hypothetical protein [Bacteroidota bacterium]